jgi:hypothetical protein
MNRDSMNKAVSNRQQATSRQATNKQHTDDADLKGFSQIRKNSAVICANLRHRSSLRGTKQSSVSCFWIASCLAMTNNCFRNDAQSLSCSSFNPVNPDSDNNNHSNHINHSSDKRKKSAKICINLRHLRAFFWIASFLAMTNNCFRKDKSNKQQAKTRSLVHLSTRSLINHINHNSDLCIKY